MYYDKGNYQQQKKKTENGDKGAVSMIHRKNCLQVDKIQHQKGGNFSSEMRKFVTACV